MSAKNTNVTPADVAAKAAEEKLVVPAQAEGEQDGPQVTDEKSDQTEAPELTVVVGGKKSLKERLAEVTQKAKDNRKILVGVGATVGAATLLFVKYAKRKAEEALVEIVDEATDEDQPATDESAA